MRKIRNLDYLVVTEDDVFCTNCEKLTTKKFPPIGDDKYFCNEKCYKELCHSQRPKRTW